MSIVLPINCQTDSVRNSLMVNINRYIPSSTNTILLNVIKCEVDRCFLDAT